MAHSSPEQTRHLLPLTNTAILDYRQHIDRYPETDPAILAYLTRHINGLMCAEIERVVTSMVKERLRVGCRDAATLNYLSSLGRSSVRNAKISEIRNSINLFGRDFTLKFNQLIDEKIGEDGIDRLGIAVGKCNEDAHENPPDITYLELETALGIALRVVEAVRVTLE